MAPGFVRFGWMIASNGWCFTTMPDNALYFGWEVANAEALDALAARLERAGVAVKREGTALADQHLCQD